MPGTFTAVVDDRLFREVVTSDNPTQQLKKLNDVLMHPRSTGRVLISKHPDSLWEPPGSPAVLSSGSIAVIDLNSSRSFLAHQRAGDVLDPGSLRDYSPPPDDRAEFEHFTQAYFAWVKKHNPAVFRDIQQTPLRTRARLRQFAADIPELVRASVQASGQSQLRRYSTGAWTRRLSAYPPTTYLGRRALLTAAYAEYNIRSEGTAAWRLVNDYDDSHYAMTSLYARHLCTTDRKLRLAVSDVSDDTVRLYASLDDIA